jgi:predicted ester cyclase
LIRDGPVAGPNRFELEGMRMASLEENKRTVRRTYEEGMNAGDVNFLDQVFTQDYVAHFPGKPPIVGLPAAKKAIGIFLAAFPDAVYTIEDLIAEGDRVVARWTARGTHLGEFQGIPPEHKIPPTLKPVVFGATDIYRMVDGKVAEEWNTIEQLDLLVQIGALKLPGQR